MNKLADKFKVLDHLPDHPSLETKLYLKSETRSQSSEKVSHYWQDCVNLDNFKILIY
jgi:hypothetical protein